MTRQTYLGQVVRVTELVSVVRTTTRGSLSHGRHSGQDGGSDKSNEFEARHCCSCCFGVVEELAVKECGVEKSVGVESWKLEVLSFAG